MSRLGLGAGATAALREMDAEDRAINYLATLPGHVAAITAVKAAEVLTRLWEIEKDEMLRRGDRRPVYLCTANERSWLNSAVATCSRDTLWHSDAASSLLHFLTGLPPDAAAFVAYKVARSALASRVGVR